MSRFEERQKKLKINKLSLSFKKYTCIIRNTPKNTHHTLNLNHHFYLIIYT